ncbi:MAG: hypothetical protein RL145_1691 [Pseudomonadota bacterium]|jgi:GntR family transcriptional regulator
MSNDKGWLSDNAKLDRSRGVPLYMELQATLRSAIESGELKPRDAIPGERDLCAHYGISRITVRKAVGGLVDEGLLERMHGSGTYVAIRIEKQFSLLSSFSEDMAARGKMVHSRWLARENTTATPEEALAFGSRLGASVYRFTRVRFADDDALAYEISTVPHFTLANEHALTTSLYGALHETGNRPVRALQRLRAVQLTSTQAKELAVLENATALFIERRGFNAKGQMVELSKSWYRGDAYDFVAELSSG